MGNIIDKYCNWIVTILIHKDLLRYMEIQTYMTILCLVVNEFKSCSKLNFFQSDTYIYYTWQKWLISKTCLLHITFTIIGHWNVHTIIFISFFIIVSIQDRFLPEWNCSRYLRKIPSCIHITINRFARAPLTNTLFVIFFALQAPFSGVFQNKSLCIPYNHHLFNYVIHSWE